MQDHKVSLNSLAELWSRDAEVYAVLMVIAWLYRILRVLGTVSDGMHSSNFYSTTLKAML